MDRVLGILLLINAIAAVVLQNRYAANVDKRPIRWRIYLSASGFAIGFLGVLFFAVAESNVNGRAVLASVLVGCFSAYGFGWQVPIKLQRIYQRRMSDSGPQKPHQRT